MNPESLNPNLQGPSDATANPVASLSPKALILITIITIITAITTITAVVSVVIIIVIIIRVRDSVKYSATRLNILLDGGGIPGEGHSHLQPLEVMLWLFRKSPV